MASFGLQVLGLVCLAFVAAHAHIDLSPGSGWIHHTISNDSKTITFDLVTPAKGWVGLGFNNKDSPSNYMQGADFLIAGVKPNETHPEAPKVAYFDDYFLLENGTVDGNNGPILDTVGFNGRKGSNSWTLVSFSENDSGTNVTLSRALNTTDEFDMVLENKEIRVIWAYHNTSDTPSMHHSVRGSALINLLGGHGGDGGSANLRFGLGTMIAAVAVAVFKSV